MGVNAFVSTWDWSAHRVGTHPWTGAGAVVFAIVLALSLVPNRMGARQRAVWYRPRLPIYATAMFVSMAAGAAFSWTCLLPGVILVALGALTLWGRNMDEEIVQARRRVRIVLFSPWLTQPGNNRHHESLGIVALVLGLFLVAPSLIGVLVMSLVVIVESRPMLTYELGLRRSGEASKYASAFWQPRVLVVVLAGLTAAITTGAAADGYFTWIDAAQNGEGGRLVLQAVLGAEVALTSVAVAALGLGIQLRAGTFGGEIALGQVNKPRLFAVFFAILVAALGTLWVLGHYTDIATQQPVVLSLAVQLGIIVCLWIIFEAASAVSDLSRSRRVIDVVKRAAETNDWEDQVRLYGWNASRMETPQSFHLLIQALHGALRADDLELFENIVSSWTASAGAQPTLAQFTFHALASPEEYFFSKELSWKEADFLDGLDEALNLVCRDVTAISKFTSGHLRALTILLDVTYPPFSRERKHHESRGYFAGGLPGFRTLDTILECLTSKGEFALVRSVLLHYFRRRARLGLVWAERYSEESDRDTFLSTPFAQRVSAVAMSCVLRVPEEYRENMRELVLGVLIDLALVAHGHSSLSTVLNKINDLVQSRTDLLWQHWGDLEPLARNGASPVRLEVGWVTESVAQIRQSSSPPVLAGFYIVDFLSYCASLSHGIANMTVDREDERRHYVRRLAVSIAALVQHAVLPEPNADEAIRNALPRWRVSEELRRFLFESTPELGANVAEEIWDWSLASAELRWLALLVDGPWARRHS